jgi:hypothetical protein
VTLLLIPAGILGAALVAHITLKIVEAVERKYKGHK